MPTRYLPVTTGTGQLVSRLVSKKPGTGETRDWETFDEEQVRNIFLDNDLVRIAMDTDLKNVDEKHKNVSSFLST